MPRKLHRAVARPVKDPDAVALNSVIVYTPMNAMNKTSDSHPPKDEQWRAMRRRWQHPAAAGDSEADAGIERQSAVSRIWCACGAGAIERMVAAPQDSYVERGAGEIFSRERTISSR